MNPKKELLWGPWVIYPKPWPDYHAPYLNPITYLVKDLYKEIILGNPKKVGYLGYRYMLQKKHIQLAKAFNL